MRVGGNTFFSSFTPAAGTSDTREPYTARSHPPRQGDEDDGDDEEDTQDYTNSSDYNKDIWKHELPQPKILQLIAKW